MVRRSGADFAVLDVEPPVGPEAVGVRPVAVPHRLADGVADFASVRLQSKGQIYVKRTQSVDCCRGGTSLGSQ